MLNFATDNEFDVFVFLLLMLALNHIPQRACCHPPRDGGIDFEKGVKGGTDKNSNLRRHRRCLIFRCFPLVYY